MKVWFSEEGQPAAAPERLLVRRSLNQEPDLKYHRSNATEEEASLKRLAEQRGLRWTIEEDIKAGNRRSRGPNPAAPLPRAAVPLRKT